MAACLACDGTDALHQNMDAADGVNKHTWPCQQMVDAALLAHIQQRKAIGVEWLVTSGP